MVDVELWDAYTADGKLIKDVVLVRNEHIKEGFYHLVCEVLVKHKDGSYLLIQRDLNKRDYPGYFEATAGGSALRGESAEDCAKRELREETGLELISIKQLGINQYPEENVIFYSFLGVTDCQKTAIVLQIGETIDYKWISEEQFINFINSDKCINTQMKRIKPHLNLILEKITITALRDKDLPLLSLLNDYNDIQEMVEENTTLLSNNDIDIFGLFCNGQIIGELRVKYNDLDTRFAIPNKRVYLYAFRILKDYQGNGLGQHLIDTVLCTLSDNGYSEFTVGVESDNETAKYLYAKFGFNKKIASIQEQYQGDEYIFDLLIKN